MIIIITSVLCYKDLLLGNSKTTFHTSVKRGKIGSDPYKYTSMELTLTGKLFGIGITAFNRPLLAREDHKRDCICHQNQLKYGLGIHQLNVNVL